ncbi:MAG: hypothetical protein F6K39_41700, partial [Okeania sp. SIO3B3]|nr:hypothetical protein [Okeania sp. SIO3B3]
WRKIARKNIIDRGDRSPTLKKIILRRVGTVRNLRIISIRIYSVNPKVKEGNTDTITIK